MEATPSSSSPTPSLTSSSSSSSSGSNPKKQVVDMEELAKKLSAKIAWKVVLFLGPPLAGKGTQAAALSAFLNIPAVSSGDLFRREVASGSALGIRMKEYMDRGELIPNDLTTSFLTQKLSEEIYQGGFILDGYPRNPSHLEILDNILAGLDRKVLGAVLFDVDRERLLARVDNRRVCSCGNILNLALLNANSSSKETGDAKCPKCGTVLTKRVDDSREVLEKRLAVYESETLPLIPILKERNLLVTLECKEDDPKQITEQLLQALSRLDETSVDKLEAYQWLQAQIGNPHMHEDVAARAAMLKQFRDKALYENRFHRSGIMRRFIYLQTTNLQKYLEHLAIFERFYGIEVLRIPPELPDTFIKTLLEQKDKDLVPLAVIREESNLFRPGSHVWSSLEHDTRAVNVAKLVAHRLVRKDDANVIVTKAYEHKTHGRIDLARRQGNHLGGIDVFGWDDIFVVENCGLTYHQLREYGIKRSSRDMVISDFLRENIYYKQLLDVEFNKQSPKRVIDFSVSVSDFIERSTLYNNPMAVEYGYRNLQTHVLNFGVFFRAAQNRRQNNYWNPGLNGGIPLTKKRDEIHELTFMAHDFGHFAIPDLIYVGNNSVRHRRAYIAWRMISEATTMTLADMLFVDSLEKSGVQYDFRTRKIYPLFLALGVNLSDKENFVSNLKKIIRANYSYCLRGDDSLYRELLKASGSDEVALNEFKEKFMPFFVEDFRWTEHNYDNMLKRAEEMRRWWQSIRPLRDMQYLKLKSIDDFLLDLEKKNRASGRTKVQTEDEFIDQVFDVVFEDQVKPVLQIQATLLPEEQRMQRGFTRWMAGQLAICSKFHFVPESQAYQKQVLDLLVQNEKGMNIETVNAIRTVYEEYLQKLVNMNLISKDDQATYAELYALFDPFYVSYDKGVSAYEDLQQVSKRVFALDTHREKQFQSVERIINRALLDTEKAFLHRISLLVEEAGGRIEDGLFVSKPGVLILSETHWNVDTATVDPALLRDAQVTFLISGIAVETSLELVAHKEAMVARLTSSKTNAMNLPLFRVQGPDVWAQKKYIEDILRYRVQFEGRFQPRTRWQNGGEVFNLSMPANKATALCYTMTLKDFHSLFIGRMGPEGNEAEVREVVRRMAKQLHRKYPQMVGPPKAYLKLSNAEKYRPQLQPTASAEARPVDSVQFVADTHITPEALAVFAALNISPEQPAYAQLSEFRSRITYLAFLKQPGTVQSATTYLRKMVEEFNHLSILAAAQVGIILPNALVQASPKLLPVLRRFGLTQVRGKESDWVLLITLKALHAFLMQAAASDRGNETLFNVIAAEAHKAFPLAIRNPDYYLTKQ